MLGERLALGIRREADASSSLKNQYFIKCSAESKNWMGAGAACDMHGTEEKCTPSFDVEN